MSVSIHCDLGREGGDYSAVCAYCKDCCTVVWMGTVKGGEPIDGLEKIARREARWHRCGPGVTAVRMYP